MHEFPQKLIMVFIQNISTVIKVLPMNILTKFGNVPTISLTQLQQRTRKSHLNLHSSSFNKQIPSNINAIVVGSAFCNKAKKHQSRYNGKLQLLKKCHVKASKQSGSRYQFNKSSMLKFDFLDQTHKSSVTGAAIRRQQILNINNNRPKILQPLLDGKTECLSLLKQQTASQYTESKNNCNRETDISSNKHSSLHCNLELLSNKRQRSFDTKNPRYIALISHRLQNDKYKKGYLKTLFSFIKMKSNINKFYLWHSKAYLTNSLNILLNHFTMQQLVRSEELHESEIQKIAFYMGCQIKQVIPITIELAQALKDMESFLKELKQNQIKEQQLKVAEQKDEVVSFSQIQQMSRLQDINQLCQTTNLPGDKVYLLTEQSDKEHIKRSIRGSTVSLRKSLLQTGLQSANSLVQTIKPTLKRQSQEKLLKEVLKFQHTAGNSQITANTLTNIRSTCSSVNAAVSECKGDSRQSTVIKKDKKANQLKNQTNKLSTYYDPYQKYSGVKYQRFCCREDFMYLVDQLERLDQNDEERAHKFFKILNAQQFIEDIEKLDIMVSTFSPLFSQKCKENLLKHILAVKERRYIEKLSEDLDFLLSQIKRTDPRNINNEDLLPYREDPILKNQFTQRIIPLKRNQDELTPFLKEAADYYSPHNASNSHFREDEPDHKLQQTELSIIRQERVEPMLYQTIYYKPLSKQQTVYVHTGNYTGEKQKQILRYMRQRHPHSFYSLSKQFSTLCSQLLPTQQTNQL